MVRKFTNIQEKEICKQYFSEEKPSTVVLAERWNCSVSIVWKIIKRNGFSLRSQSEAMRGKESPMKGKHHSETTKRKMSKFFRMFTEEQEQQICNEYFSKEKPSIAILAKKWNCSLFTIEKTINRLGFSLRTCTEVVQTKEGRKKKSIQMQKIMRSSKIRRKISKTSSFPKNVQQSLKNGRGNNCYYDNEFFPSNAERDCYIKLKKSGFKVKHNFEGRFDFLINNKVVVEFHPFDFKLTDKQYYIQRRELLDEYGHKDLKLIVIKSLNDANKNIILI